MKSVFIPFCKLLSRYCLYCVVSAFLVLTMIKCDVGNDPQDDAPRVLMSLRNTKGEFKTLSDVVVDTTGNFANVRILLHACSNIQKLRVQIINLQDNSLDYDTIYNFVSYNTTDSLITFSKVYSTAGTKELSAVATMGDFSTKGVSLRFKVIQRPFINKAPEIYITGLKSITNVQACTLIVKVKDDDGQKSSVVVKDDNAEHILDINGQYVIKPKQGFVGTDTVEIVATDNYTTPLSSKEMVLITILASEQSAPSAPNNLKVSSQTTSDVTLVWDNVLMAVDYAIYRSVSADKDFTKLKDSLIKCEYIDTIQNNVW